LSFALGRLGWPPQTVWAATLPELEHAARPYGTARKVENLTADTLAHLMSRFPDQTGGKHAHER